MQKVALRREIEAGWDNLKRKRLYNLYN